MVEQMSRHDIKIVKDCISETINQYKIEDNENMFEVQFSIDDQLPGYFGKY